MNIAILIGISNYTNASQLPACRFDGENMRQLLTATKKYDDIQIITENTTANQVKESLRQFFEKYQNTVEIDEAFVYFSGHGTYQNDALLCCSDYDHSRPSSTSINNSELDDLLRSVSPKVAVKIIDACQSGSNYIKQANVGFAKALQKSSLNSFICMASSRQDQDSYASENESHFTKKWIDAALSKDDGSIYYRDIQASLADAFSLHADQNPFFVNQGSGLEIFSTVTEEMKALTSGRIKTPAPEKPEKTIALLIKSQVQNNDEAFIEHDIVLNAVEQSKKAVEDSPILESLVEGFYKKSVNTELKLQSIPKAQSVASFAQEKSWTKRYFVKVITESYQEKVFKDPFSATLGVFGNINRRWNKELSDEHYVMETRNRPFTLDSTEPLPFEVAELSYNSNHPSLPSFLIYIGLVHSLTEVMILSATFRLAQRGWKSRSPELSEVEWRYQAQPWAAVVKDPKIIWRDAQNRGENEIKSYLESLLPKSETSITSTPMDIEFINTTTAASNTEKLEKRRSKNQ